MRSITSDLRSADEELQQRVRSNVRALMRHYGVNNGQLAVALDVPRHWVQERLGKNKATNISAPDLLRFARAFGAPTDVLFLEDKDEVIRWALDESPDLLIHPSTCFTASGAATARSESNAITAAA
jgi:hypothetical protein